MTTEQRTLCILGEHSLVEEYAELCVSKGFTVQVRLNAADQGRRHPSGTTRVRKPTKTVDLALELTNIDLKAKKKNLVELDKLLHPDTLICSSSVTATVRQQVRWISHPKRLVGIGAFPSLLSGTLVEMAVSPLTTPPMISAAEKFIQSLDRETALVQDAVGLVMPRILCMIVNEACFALADGVALQNELDDAMKLGADYPDGPLEWKDKVGSGHVRAVLEALQREVDKQRYRIAPLLRQARSKNPSPRR